MMNTNELKAAIERFDNQYPDNSDADYFTVLALAEIGRLAVVARASEKMYENFGTTYMHDEFVDDHNNRNAAIDAFLAAREGK